MSERWIGIFRRERPKFVPPEAKREKLKSESMEPWPQGVLSLDISFDENDVPYVFEIHGRSAGIGMERIEDHEFERPIDKRVRQIARTWNEMGHKYQNPSWFLNIDRDKAGQAALIPEQNRPETIVNEDFSHLFAKGKVIVKPRDESEGSGIKIFNASQQEEARAYAEQLKARDGAFVAQQFIESKGADLAPEDLKGHAASMRLLIPFKRIDGKIIVTIPRFGYQRVAPYGRHEVGQKIRGVHVTEEEAGVVNIARGAASVPMSEREYNLVLPVALQMIENISKYAETTEEFKRDRGLQAMSDAIKLQEEIRKKHHLYLQAYPTGDAEHENAAQGGLTSLQFLRKLEEQVLAIDPAMRETKIMRRRNRDIQIFRIPNAAGELKGVVRLQHMDLAHTDYEFDANDRGSLQRAIAKFIKEKSPLI